MVELFATYTISLLMKELGFNQKCFGYFDEKGELMSFPKLDVFWNDNNQISWNRHIKNLFRKSKSAELMCLAPTWEQVESWLRDVHGIAIAWNISSGWDCSYNPFKTHFLFNVVKSVGDCRTTSFLNVRDRDVYYHSYNYGREQSMLKAIEKLKETLI